MSDQYIVYTDGACAPSNPGPAAWGAVVIGPTGKCRRFYGFLGQGTNQKAEIAGAWRGLQQTPLDCDVELVCDSQYVLKGLKEWRAGWERRGWKNSAGEPVANQELWKRLFHVADERNVTTRWVKGHAGDKYNEQADALANEGLRAVTVGEVFEYTKAGVVKPEAKRSYKVGDYVGLESSGEVGIVLAVWVDEVGKEQVYVAMYGQDTVAEGKPDTKPTVHRYASVELLKA